LWGSAGGDLLLGGMAFTYYMLLPSALPFLLNFLGIQAELRPQSYFAFITGLMFWIGVACEFPLVVYFLTAMGLIRPQALRRQWRLAIMIIAVGAAAITPTVDPGQHGPCHAPNEPAVLHQHRAQLRGRCSRRRPQQEKTHQEASA